MAVGGVQDVGGLVTREENCEARKQFIVYRQRSEGSELIVWR